MGRIFAVTAKSINGAATRIPKVVYLSSDALTLSAAVTQGNGTKIYSANQHESNTFVVYEEGMQIELARAGIVASDPYTGMLNLILGATGLTQETANPILPRFYLIYINGGEIGVDEGLKLPPATVGKCLVIISGINDPALIFPSLGEFINNQLVNTSYSIPAGKRKHFVCPTTAGKWVIAEDYT